MVAELPRGGSGSKRSLHKLRKTMSPRAWRAWLKSEDGIAQAGTDAARRELLRIARRQQERKSTLGHQVPSATWLESAVEDDVEFPPPGNRVRMVVSIVSGRYTPPQCLAVEDFLDSLTPAKATFYEFPESVSARAILEIGAVQGKPIGGQW